MGCQTSREFVGYGATREISIDNMMRYVRFYYPDAEIVQDYCYIMTRGYSPIHFEVNEESTIKARVVICNV